MKSAALPRHLSLSAAPRRFGPTSARPGARVFVIIPSKGHASGSNGKRVPLLWTSLPDSGSLGVLKRKQVLEEMYSRDAAEPPYCEDGASPALVPSPGPEQQQPDRQGFTGAAPEQQTVAGHGIEQGLEGGQRQQPMPQRTGVAAAGREDQDRAQQPEEELQMDLSVLRERIASAAMASTSARAPAAATSGAGAYAALGSDGPVSRSQHRRNFQQHQQQFHQRVVSAPVSARSTSGAHRSGADGTADVQLLSETPYPRPDLQSHSDDQVQHSPLNNGAQGVAAEASSHFTDHQRDNQRDNARPQSQLRRLEHHNSHHISHHHHHLQNRNSNGTQYGEAVGPAEAVVLTSAEATSGAVPYKPAAASAAAGAGTSPTAAARDSSIPGSIWILCCISAALTCASCIFNTALPIYMVSELKMSMRSMGMFEGLLEAFSYVVRMCSGVVSDRMTSRKAAITLGFAAGAMAKFGMASAGSVGVLFAGKAVDRLANGIQAAPRDALIGDLSPPGVRSACFGLAQSLRKWGSAVGALAAFFLMKASNNNYQLIFYSASTVSLAACLAFVLLVPAHKRDPAPAPAPEKQAAAAAPAVAAPPTVTGAPAPPSTAGNLITGVQEFLRSVRSMGADFYRMLGVISLYALGHINESLLEARAMEVGFGKAEATLVVAAIAAVTFLTAYPLGLLDDRFGAGTTFAVGIGALIAGDLVLLLSGTHPLALFASCLFLGVHWAVIQGPLLSIVSGLAPANLRGTAFGIFYTVMAITAVAANTMYGTIWHTYGANAAFATSAALMAAVLTALPYMLPASARRGGAAAPTGTAAAAPAPTAATVQPSGSGPLASLGVSMTSLAGNGDNGNKSSTLLGAPLPAAA